MKKFVGIYLSDDSGCGMEVKDCFENCNMDYEIPEDINYSLWLKYMLNVSTAGTIIIVDNISLSALSQNLTGNIPIQEILVGSLTNPSSSSIRRGINNLSLVFLQEI